MYEKAHLERKDFCSSMESLIICSPWRSGRVNKLHEMNLLGVSWLFEAVTVISSVSAAESLSRHAIRTALVMSGF